MAKLLARGIITISVVNDGYALLLTVPSVSIPTDSNTNLLDLKEAITNISLLKGDIKQEIFVTNLVLSDLRIEYNLHQIDNYEWTLALTYLPEGLKTGHIEFEVQAHGGYSIKSKFVFTVIPQAIDIDWLREWEGTRTQLKDNYVITPRLFAGKKVGDKLTGVYMGRLKGYMGQTLPYTFEEPQAGIYGYREDELVFYISDQGAMISGWTITKDAIQTQDGTLTIKSEGTISSQQTGESPSWLLNKNGNASFANNRVRLFNNGDAFFEGSITSTSGNIANWKIEQNAIYNAGTSINAAKHFIAVSNTSTLESKGENNLQWVKNNGGSAMYYTNGNDYGFIAYKGAKKVFSAGSENFIAGWKFEEDAVFSGARKVNAKGNYDEGGITIGSNGLRGASWYIDNDGSACFGKGVAVFDGKGGTIAGWSIDEDAIFIGTKNNVTGHFTDNQNSLTIGSAGIRSNGWRFEKNGSGSFAKDKISWDTNGNVTFDPSISMRWESGINIANVATFGQMLHRDPEFLDQEKMNGIAPYLKNSAFMMLGDSKVPNSTSMALRVYSTTWNKVGDLRAAGLGFGDQSRPNGKFMVKIIAKIPENWYIQIDHNHYGIGGKTEWLTPRMGTGKYEEYVYMVTCGALSEQGMQFDTINYLSLKYQDNDKYEVKAPQSNLTIVLHDKTTGQDVTLPEIQWFVAYATTFDATKSERFMTTIDADGIYTGTLTAEQVNALTCTFDKGTIGGWQILANSISKGNVRLGKDGTIAAGDFWKLGKDGDGFLSKGAISWDTGGKLEVSGKITATEGKIGNFNIKEGNLYSDTTSPAALIFTHQWDTFTINNRQRVNEPFVSVSSTSSTVMQIRVGTRNATALELLAETSAGKNYALESTGNVKMETRANESVVAHGLIMNTRYVRGDNQATLDIYLNDDFLVFGNSGTLTMNMPDPGLCSGKIYYMKRLGTGTVTLIGDMVVSNTAAPSTNYQIKSSHSIMFISDGTHWVHFYCG